MGHSGKADWSWAGKAKQSVKIPVIVNGDVKCADDAARAIAETGCEGVMVGRRAIEHPWVFREIYGLLREGKHVAQPTDMERIELCKEHLMANVAERGEPYGVRCTRRHLSGYLHGLRGASELRQKLNVCDSLQGCLAILDEWVVRASHARDLHAAPVAPPPPNPVSEEAPTGT
jgi:tRNA-dihydrouridine synthase